MNRRKRKRMLAAMLNASPAERAEISAALASRASQLTQNMVELTTVMQEGFPTVEEAAQMFSAAARAFNLPHPKEEKPQPPPPPTG